MVQASAGLSLWAITDHDTLAGWRAVAGAKNLIPGVEASADHDGREVHLVALGFDPEDPGLTAHLAGVRIIRRARLAAWLEHLPDEIRRGIQVADLEDSRAPEAGDALSRDHLARALVRRGGVPDRRQVFAHWLGDEHAQDARVPPFPTVAEVARVIHAAGGVVLVAHPGVHRTAALVTTLVEEGCDGIEALLPGADPTLNAQLLGLAEERRWLLSAGTDRHRLGLRGIGVQAPQHEGWQRLKDLLASRMGAAA